MEDYGRFALELYPWSSASAHCGLVESEILTKKSRWLRKFRQMPDWSKWLSEGNCENEDETIRRHSQKGSPCGSSQFISKLERLSEGLLVTGIKAGPGKTLFKGADPELIHRN